MQDVPGAQGFVEAVGEQVGQAGAGAGGVEGDGDRRGLFAAARVVMRRRIEREGMLGIVVLEEGCGNNEDAIYSLRWLGSRI